MLDVNSELFVANIDGSDMKNLTDHPAFEGWPAWSPDGKRIAFGANRNSELPDLRHELGRHEREARRQYRRPGHRSKMEPDGRTIYFTNCWKTGFKSACEIFSAPAPAL